MRWRENKVPKIENNNFSNVRNIFPIQYFQHLVWLSKTGVFRRFFLSDLCQICNSCKVFVLLFTHFCAHFVLLLRLFFVNWFSTFYSTYCPFFNLFSPFWAIYACFLWPFTALFIPDLCTLYAYFIRFRVVSLYYICQVICLLCLYFKHHWFGLVWFKETDYKQKRTYIILSKAWFSFKFILLKDFYLFQ